MAGRSRTAPASPGTPEPDRRFSENLLAWYRAHRRLLPWRKHRDPYRIWISEIMLQQTTVRAVIPYFERWMSRFPDVRSLADAPLREVLRAWQGLGYYARARNLHEAARRIVREHRGRIPDDEKTLGTLPGFGPYTTAAVLSLAFGRPCPVIDANVRRVLMRLLGREGEASAVHDRILLIHLRSFIPAEKPGTFNQAMMELGALICRTRNPQCLICPVLEYCRAAREGRQEVIPRPKKRITKKIEAVVAVIRRDNRYLLQKRGAKGLLAGLWEFPGGKTNPGETLEEALRREVREEVGAGIRKVRYLTTVNHAYTQFQVKLHAFGCELSMTPALPKASYRWVSLTSIRRYPLPSGSVRIVNYLTNSGPGRYLSPSSWCLRKTVSARRSRARKSASRG